MAKVDLDRFTLSLGKKTRLHRMLYEHGPANGTMMVLPVDQGLEHGPIDFFDNPDALDPRWIINLADEGGFSAVALQYGLASKYMHPWAGKVPLILKLNGKTNVPSDAQALSPVQSTVEDAVRLGADAIGYTLYVGSPAQVEDFRQFSEVRREADRYGMPVIVWAYPRGEAIDRKGGKDSLYAIDYAARVAAELGADMIKLNIPKFNEAKMKDSPPPYDELNLGIAEAMAKVVASASGVPVIVSGGGKISDEELLNRARASLEAGVVGFIFGRNMFQRKLDDALSLARRVRELLVQEG